MRQLKTNKLNKRTVKRRNVEQEVHDERNEPRQHVEERDPDESRGGISEEVRRRIHERQHAVDVEREYQQQYSEVVFVHFHIRHSVEQL